MIAQRIQLVGWVIFLFYYCIAKYFVGGFTGFSIGYLISVIMLIALTAIIPFYATKWLLAKLEGWKAFAIALALPVVFTMTGLSLYFVVFIAPNYPSITLSGILHRAVEPGVVITILLMIPLIASLLARKEGADT